VRPDSDIRVRAGSLRHPITIQQRVPGSPPTYNNAGPVLVPVPVLTNVMAQISPARATQMVRAGQTVTETIIPISIRYNAAVTAAMEVVFNGNLYRIEGIIDFDERHWLMELECLALGPNL
jgi:SPP1 family predicted phage head-tail adaptor